MTEDLIDCYKDCEKLMPFLHLPIQSGSNKILKLMNRKHNKEYYLSIIEKLKNINKDIKISSDFIVGYPGETESDFEATLELVYCVTYAQAYSFKYSPRPGTPAALQENQVPGDVSADRLRRLQSILDQQKISFNQGMVGRELPVLVDRVGRRPGQLVGRSPYMQAVHLTGSKKLLGNTVKLRIKEAHTNSLSGLPLSPNEDRQPLPQDKVS